MDIQWYPGHMAKTRRELKEILPLLNIIVEVADARLPISSRNPDLGELLGNKPRILLLNKSDLGEADKTKSWVDYYRSHNQRALSFNAKTGEGMAQLDQTFVEMTRAREEHTKPGRGQRLRIGVVGVPNVGKSSVLNRLVGRSAAQVGNKPGVTRGRQWVKKDRWDVLDTPGLLWPKIEDPEAGWFLAFIGTIKPEILDWEELAVRLIEMIKKNYPSRLENTYGLNEQGEPTEILHNLGKKRGCLIKGGQVDWLRAANLLWSDFRTGSLGRFTLEDPPSFPLFGKEDAERISPRRGCSNGN